MGYTTDFGGSFKLNKPLTPKMHDFLVSFSESRRMGRNVDAKFGIEGEFYVEGKDRDSDIIDHNQEPSTQPGLWCQWVPTSDGNGIEWDGGEKFYKYTEWLVYLIHKILAPNGYVLNGVVEWSGEDSGDVGEIFVEDNRVFTKHWRESEREEITPENSVKMVYNNGYKNQRNYMRTDVVFIIDEDDETPTQDQVVNTIIKNANPKMTGIDLESFRSAFEGDVYLKLVKLFKGEN